MVETIYASAQEFGFGPAATLYGYLACIKNHDKNINIHLIANPALDIFHDNHPGIVNSKCVDLPPNYDPNVLVISAFDPVHIVKGWLKGLKTIYICNLFWFWDIDPKEIAKHAKKLLCLKSKPELALEYFLNLYNSAPHSAIFLGYVLSDVTFIRRFPNCEKEMNKLKLGINYKLTKVVISNMPQTLPTSKRDKRILIQLSGSKCPFVNTHEHEVYIKFIEKLFTHTAKKFHEFEFHIIMNPNLIKFFQKKEGKPENLRIINSLAQNELLDLLSSSMAVFTSPGLQTIYEAIALQTPIFLLPEQNAGQYSNYQLLKKMGIDLPGILHGNLNHKNKASFKSEKDAGLVYSALEEWMRDENRMSKIFEEISSYIRIIMNKSNDITKQHIEALEKTMGSPPYETPHFILNELV